MELWSWGAESNHGLRWAFLELSLEVAVKSNFSIERHRVFRNWLLMVIPFTERPFCGVLFVGHFLCTREWSCHDIQCFVVCFFFPEETTYYTSWISRCDDECLLQKACWQMNMLFLFGENQQKAVCYLGWYLAYLYIKPKFVCINDYVLCQYMAWHFKKSWVRQVLLFLTCFSSNSLEYSLPSTEFQVSASWVTYWHEVVLYLHLAISGVTYLKFAETT